MEGLDAAILMNPLVWKASGHEDHFTDPMVDCQACKRRFRADQFVEQPWLALLPGHKGNRIEITAGDSCKHCGVRSSVPGVRQRAT